MRSPEVSNERQLSDARGDRSAFQSSLNSEAGLLSLACLGDGAMAGMGNGSAIGNGAIGNGAMAGMGNGALSALEGKASAGKPLTTSERELLDQMKQEKITLRDQMSFTSIAFCSPLMLFGMGAAMAAFDEFGGNKTIKSQPGGRFTRGGAAAFAPGYSKFAHEEADKAFDRMVSRTNVSSLTDVGTMRARKEPKRQTRKETSYSQSGAGVYYAETRFRQKQAQEMLEARKLVKAKTRLEEEREKVLRAQNFSLSCQLSSRMELLDKTLKRLGV